MLLPITLLTRSATVPNNRTLRTPLDIIPLPTRLALDLSQPVHVILIDFLHRLLPDLLCCHPAPRQSTVRIDKNEDQEIVLAEIGHGCQESSRCASPTIDTGCAPFGFTFGLVLRHHWYYHLAVEVFVCGAARYMGGSDKIRRDGMGLCPVLDWFVVKRLETDGYFFGRHCEDRVRLELCASRRCDCSEVEESEPEHGEKNALASGFQRFLHGYVTTALTSTSTLIPMFFVVHQKH
jgi:hypothetical protein